MSPIKIFAKTTKGKLGKLATRAALLYIVIPAVSLGVLLLMVSIISRDISRDTAWQLARQYSIEAAANFQISTHQHFLLMQQVARSTTIARWLDNEDDHTLKAAAFDEIMGYARFSPGTRLMFTVYSTLQGYDFNTNLTLEDFTSWGQLAGGEVSQWFFDTRDAQSPFVVNIQRERPEMAEELIVLFVWSNHRVYYQDRFVGVVTVGFPFEYVFDTVFGNFDASTRRGYIIDKNGAVRADSAGLLAVTELGLPTFPSVPEADDNPILADSIARHLQTMDGGVFSHGPHSYSGVPLPLGMYQFAGIAPIIGTDWSVVVLLTQASFFNGIGRSYIPLLTAAVVSVLLSALIGSLLVRKMVLVPLFKLNQSAVAYGISTTEDIFGMNRDDEIGELARTIDKAMTSLKEQVALELIESERETFELTQKILNSAPFIINLWDDNYNLISTNPQAVILHGLESQEQYLKEFFNLSPRYQPDGMLSSEKAMIKLATVYRRGRVEFEWMHSRLDGSPIPTKITIVRTTHKGKTILLGYTTDLSQVKEAEELTRNLLDNSPLFMEFWDENGNMFDCNQRMVETFGVVDKAEFTKRFYKFSTPIQPCGASAYEMNTEYISTAMEKGSCRGEWSYLLPNGEELPTEATWVRINHNDKPMVIVYSHDLRPLKEAERRRIETLDEINQAKSRFLARMSHEIRTPITAVLGISEIQLRSQDVPCNIREGITQIHDSATILLGIVNDILDFSKIESGNMALIEKEYAVASLISNAARLRLVYLEHKNIVFELHVDEDLPVALVGDELRIRQIINNLLSNAFKYTNRGSVKLSLRKEQSDKEGFIGLNISIQDTGLGMTPQQLETLVSHSNEYKRFHEHDDIAAGGTGLGISIVYSLAQMMGATINFKSEVDVGTFVVIQIPQKTLEGKKAINLGKEMVQSLQKFEQGTWSDKDFDFVPKPMPYGNVLVVDDVEANLYVAQKLLGFYELNVETVTNGNAAIDRITEKYKNGHAYDIVFMDETMPELSGTETMHILRGLGYSHPIVALTANALVGQEEEFIETGFDGFVSKPIKSKHLHSVLIKFIEDKQHPETIAKTQKRAGSLVTKEDLDNFENDPDMVNTLRLMFVDNQKDFTTKITHALAEGDIKTAHRLAHTLKSSARLIAELRLEELAENAEIMLIKGETLDSKLLDELDEELSRVLKDIASG